MLINNFLGELGMNPNNTIVIGSGILNALNIRESKDIDVVVSEEKYQELSQNTSFQKQLNHGNEILADEIFEISTGWTVLGKTWKFDDFLIHSIVLDNIRYLTLEFLLDVKLSWLKDPDVRQKDIDDIELIKHYLARVKNN